MEQLVHTADEHRIILLALQPSSSLDSFARNDELERDNRFCLRSCALSTVRLTEQFRPMVDFCLSCLRGIVIRTTRVGDVRSTWKLK